MTATAKVLVCDDDRINLEVVRELLQDEFEVATAESGEACLAKIPEFQPDVVLLDIMMPGIDGYETCRRIVAAPDDCVPQIIFLSARESTQDRLKGYEAGGDDFLTKPYDHNELRAKVRSQTRLGRALGGILEGKVETEAHEDLLERLVNERTAKLQTAKERLEDLARELAESNTELAVLARIDSLTKLLDRAAWNELAQREQERSKWYNHPFSIAIIDVDHFKAYNDSQGHGAGDTCLRQVAQEIANRCSAGEFVGRYGGEEFVLLAPEMDLDGCRVLAERIRSAIEELNISHPASSTIDRVTISIGVASGADVSWEVLLKEADDALYKAKKSGRNQVCAVPATAGATSSAH